MGRLFFFFPACTRHSILVACPIAPSPRTHTHCTATAACRLPGGAVLLHEQHQGARERARHRGGLMGALAAGCIGACSTAGAGATCGDWRQLQAVPGSVACSRACGCQGLAAVPARPSVRASASLAAAPTLAGVPVRCG
jgi:hypothetical protein